LILGATMTDGSNTERKASWPGLSRPSTILTAAPLKFVDASYFGWA
jgi:hypothetical protein